MTTMALVIDDMPRMGFSGITAPTLTSTDVLQELSVTASSRSAGSTSAMSRRWRSRATTFGGTLGGRPIFFARAKDGKVRAFYNTCTHRGAMICRQEHGNGDVFQCFYHAWTFNNEGQLIGRPDEAGYSEGFDTVGDGPEVPHAWRSYRGFLFINFNPHAEDLPTYLAGAKEYMDLMIDQSESDMRVVDGSNKYVMKCNWKLLVENSMDGYHLIPTHNTYLEYSGGLGHPVRSTNVRRWSKHSGPRQRPLCPFLRGASTGSQWPLGRLSTGRTPRRSSLTEAPEAWWSGLARTRLGTLPMPPATCTSTPT